MAGIATGLRQSFENEPALKHTPLKLLGLSLANMASEHGDAVRVKSPAKENQHLMRTLEVEHQPIEDPSIEADLQHLKRHLDLKTEGASGISVAPALEMPEYQPKNERLVVSIISGSNV
ncbi:MAG: hypothetical protein VKK59_00735 [Vampirovibrionales bacterium]|nr:hypothetical protein [Vampirovibrionales bacterium]